MSFLLLIQNFKPEIKPADAATGLMSIILWCGSAVYLCNLFGAFRGPVFVAVAVIFGSYYIMRGKNSNRNRSKSNDGDQSELSQSRSRGMSETWEAESEELEDVDPNLYLKWLTIACVFIYVSQRLWLCFLLLVPLFCGIMKRSGKSHFFFTPQRPVVPISNYSESATHFTPRRRLPRRIQCPIGKGGVGQPTARTHLVAHKGPQGD